MDSTILDDAVATQDTVTQLIAAIRRVRREVPGAAEVIAAHCTAHDYDDPGKPAIAWNDKAAREQLIDALVGDAHRLLGYLPDQELGPKAAEAVALLALIAGQDVEPVDGSPTAPTGGGGSRQGVAPDRVISVTDPDARHAHKTVHRRQDGFKAHIAIEPDTGIVTDCELTKASGEHSGDAQVGPGLLADEPEPTVVLGDSAYGSGEARAELADAGHQAVIKPIPLRPAVPGGFTLDDFTINHDAGTVTCPNGADPADHRRPGGELRSRPAPGARCARSAPPAAPVEPSRSTNTKRCCGPPAGRPKPRSSKRFTAGTGPWSNGRSRGSPAATDGSGTAASRRTTTGCTTGSPR